MTSSGSGSPEPASWPGFAPETSQLLAELESADAAQRAAGDRGPLSLRALAPSVARLVVGLGLAAGAQRLVELGTSHGYSTVALAEVARRTGGRLTSVDADPAKHALAAANLERAGLRDRVQLLTAPVAEAATELPAAIDLLLIDVPLEGVTAALPRLLERLAPRVAVFADGAPDRDVWVEGAGLTLVEALRAAGLFVSRVPVHKVGLLATRCG